MIPAVRTHNRTLLDRLAGGPAGFRNLLERQGPTFIKMGQFLALRPDLIPEEYCDELMNLLERVPPFPWQQARDILTEELGAKAENVFAFINPNPIAAGSLAQTHIARLTDGTEVAVKVLRPGIEQRVRSDLRRIRRIARLLRLAGISSIVAPQDVVNELTTWLLQEIDLDRERANMERLYRFARQSAIERIPRPYPDLCTSRVLTAEYIKGISFGDLLSGSSLPLDPTDLEELEIDRGELAANLLRACLGQMFEYKFFHADVHPGNLLALPGNVVGFVDFGLCDHLDENVREQQMRYLNAVYERDIDGMFKALTQVLIPGTTTDMEAFRADFFAETRDYLSHSGERTPADRAHDARSPIARWMTRVVRSARRHQLKFPPRILSMYRALLTAETVARLLSRNVNLRMVGREFFRSLRSKQILKSFEPERMEPVILNFLALLRDSPAQLQQILSDLAGGRMTAKVYAEETQRVRQAHNRRAQMIAASILTVAVAVLLGRPRLPLVLGVPIVSVLIAAEVVLVVIVLWRWRQLR